MRDEEFLDEPEPVVGESTLREVFTDDEAAFLRHVRFGELPDRVRPDDWVELAETDPRRDVPESAVDPETARRLHWA